MKPLIAISNDDGFQAKGIQELITLARTLGDVLVVAPNGPRSAQSSALSIHCPISLEQVDKADGYKAYISSGTPADCMKLALNSIAERKPDLVISGINHGSNTSINVIYSGTMGVAFEGNMHGIPSIGFSLCSHSAEADFSHCLPYFKSIIESVLEKGLPEGVCLNVNAPKTSAIKGIKIGRQSKGQWLKEFTKAEAPRPNDYYWLTGQYTQKDGEDILADQTQVDDNYISVVPVQVDMTAYHALDNVEKILHPHLSHNQITRQEAEITSR